ncbi:MAG: hypothetical protein HY727_00010 [Candidatus Rokubacteria bacterium]|nr:hypothetical protein [Candidatus Rokubacteria bacterium]
MKPRLLVVTLALAALVALDAAPGHAQTSGVTPSGQYFRLEWEAGKTRSGRPRIDGYLYNDHGLGAVNVQLVVEVLDAGGQVTGHVIGYVTGEVPAKGRAYFSVALPAAGAGYRLQVRTFDWRGGGGAGA